MSAFKKASKLNQKTHRERHQPEKRQHLGLLEKHKDYVKRAQDVNEKRDTLKLLHKRALNKNPDEFYHHMINSKLENGAHRELNKKKGKDTPEQLQLMRTQDLKYITFKRTQEFKKIEKLQAQLHLASIKAPIKNTHIRFRNNLEEPDKKATQYSKILEEIELPDVDLEDLAKATRKRKQKYIELAKRINREKELSLIEDKIRIKKYLQDSKNVLKPKQINSGSTDRAPVYKWTYERKK